MSNKDHRKDEEAGKKIIEAAMALSGDALLSANSEEAGAKVVMRIGGGMISRAIGPRVQRGVGWIFRQVGEWLGPERVEEATATPDGEDLVAVIFRSLLEVPDPVVLPVLANIARDFIEQERAVDQTLRRIARMVVDCNAGDLEALRRVFAPVEALTLSGTARVDFVLKRVVAEGGDASTAKWDEHGGVGEDSDALNSVVLRVPNPDVPTPPTTTRDLPPTTVVDPHRVIQLLLRDGLARAESLWGTTGASMTMLDARRVREVVGCPSDDSDRGSDTSGVPPWLQRELADKRRPWVPMEAASGRRLAELIFSPEASDEVQELANEASRLGLEHHVGQIAQFSVDAPVLLSLAITIGGKALALGTGAYGLLRMINDGPQQLRTFIEKLRSSPRVKAIHPALYLDSVCEWLDRKYGKGAWICDFDTIQVKQIMRHSPTVFGLTVTVSGEAVHHIVVLGGGSIEEIPPNLAPFWE